MATPDALRDMMGAVLTRWTMGSAAAPVADAWRAELGADAGEAELRLLGLAGQFLAVAVTLEPPADLRVLPDLPALASPSLPEPLRPLLRRVLAGGTDPRARCELLHFLAGRGWTVHPADWMPAASDDEAPDVYAPWRDWAVIAASAEPRARQAGDVLTAETWDDFWPAMRRVALADLRRADPASARALLEAKLAGVAAEERLRLVEVLANRVSDADRDFLQTLATSDRAPKVKALASSLLGRLGYGSAAGEGAAELAGFFEIRTKGLLRRTKVITARDLKNPAQRNRRRQLFAEVEVAAFAAALQLTTDDLGEMWSWGDDVQADMEFAAMAVQSGSDRLVQALVAGVSDRVAALARVAVVLRPRFTDGQKAELAERALAAGEDFSSALSIAGGAGRVDEAIDTRAGAALIKSLGAEDANAAKQVAELRALGLLASRAGARKAMERLARAGLIGADPRLDMLRLNAELTTRE